MSEVKIDVPAILKQLVELGVESVVFNNYVDAKVFRRDLDTWVNATYPDAVLEFNSVKIGNGTYRVHGIDLIF